MFRLPFESEIMTGRGETKSTNGNSESTTTNIILLYVVNALCEKKA